MMRGQGEVPIGGNGKFGDILSELKTNLGIFTTERLNHLEQLGFARTNAEDLHKVKSELELLASNLHHMCCGADFTIKLRVIVKATRDSIIALNVDTTQTSMQAAEIPQERHAAAEEEVYLFGDTMEDSV